VEAAVVARSLDDLGQLVVEGDLEHDLLPRRDGIRQRHANVGLILIGRMPPGIACDARGIDGIGRYLTVWRLAPQFRARPQIDDRRAVRTVCPT